MEGLRTDDPPRIGEYTALARLDAVRGPRRAPERRYLARSADGGRTVLISLPAPGADPGRWAAQAQWASRLDQPGFWPVEQLGGTAASPWHASRYRPVLPLTSALAAQGGPLPEATVRAMGATLAEALASARVLGLTHAGICPASVLLTAYGPVLACFGAARAAAPDGVPRAGLPGLDQECLAPEQLAGAAADPRGDLYSLGAVLAYAATGHAVPERAEIPAGLQGPISACLSRDPDDRPEPARLLAELAPGAAYGTLTAGTDPAPLPGRVVAALSEQAASALAAELPTKVH